jgi:hypothetical protein
VAIASFVDHNYSSLLAHDIYAPMRNALLLIHTIAKSENLDRLVFFDAKKLREKRPDIAARCDDLGRNCQDHRDHDILLTTQTLWGRLVRRDFFDNALMEEVDRLLVAIKQYFSDHTVKIILHLRRADGYMDSLYQANSGEAGLA